MDKTWLNRDLEALEEVEMERPKFMEIEEGYARFRPEGHVSLQEAVELIGQAIAFCYDHNISKLLVNTTQLTGFLPPTIADRFFIAHDWAQKAKSLVIVAMVVRPEVVDPGKFEVIAAANVGQRAEMFTSEPEALEWLLSQK
ncbi:MAG: hypothetical protein JWR26_3040 [Pedosphaera sp.]|nr:hypothetical protein [Pedosphaera sp.]